MTTSGCWKNAEMLQDIGAYDEAKRAVTSGEELVPSEVTYAILDGGNPIHVWREVRKLTQQQLAGAAGISVPYLSQIESGKRRGGARSWRRLPGNCTCRWTTFWADTFLVSVSTYQLIRRDIPLFARCPGLCYYARRKPRSPPRHRQRRHGFGYL